MARNAILPVPAGLPLPQRLLVALLFAASGSAALVDQVVWTRWLNLSLGSSSYAAIVVLASFMAGLGLGSWLSGRLADRVPRRALLFFAAAEFGVGVWSFVSIPLLADWLPRWTAALAGESNLPTLPLLTRALLAAASLALPTILMGATLPLLARWVVSAGGVAGRDIGLFYTLNTLGGALGTLLAAFWLIDSLGLARAVAVSGAADLAVALAAAAFALRVARTHESRSHGPGPAPVPVNPAALPAPLLAAGFAFFVSGLCGLALEVVSHRVLAVLAGSNAYAFSLMLAAFLIGIALGSLAAARLAERSMLPGGWLAIALAFLTVGIGFSRRVFEGKIFYAAGAAIAEIFGQDGSSWTALLAACFVALLPASLALGFVVPLVARLAAFAPQRLARRFGLAYALNTLGAVAGTILAGLLLIPAIGTARTLGALSLLASVAALVTIYGAVPASGRRRTLSAVAALAALGLILGWGTDPVRDRLLGNFRGKSVLAYREGPVQTIAVIQENNLQQLDFLRLVTNQTSLTGTHLYAKRYMRLLGHLPLLYSREQKRALVICLGTGMTAAAVASHEQVKELDIAEISPEVVSVAPLFEDVSQGVLRDPRTKLLVDDGRHVLLASNRPWDIITLEPPPPRDSGVVSLYTTEFYELCRRRLMPGGVLAQWIPLHSQSEAEIRMLIRSFLDAFPQALGFLPVERDLLLLGSDRELRINPETLAEALAEKSVHDSLQEIGLASPSALLATAMFGRRQLDAIAADAPPVTDDRPRVEYFARHSRRPPLPPIAGWTKSLLPLEELLEDSSVPPDLESSFAQEQGALLEALRGAWLGEAGQVARGSQQQLAAYGMRPDNAYFAWAAGVSDAHIARLRARANERPEEAAGWRELALRLTQKGESDEAVAIYRRALAANPRDTETLLQFGVLLMGPGQQPAEGRALLTRLVKLAPGHPAAAAIRNRLGLH